MTLSVSTKGLHLIVKECINKQLFCRLNFLTNASTGPPALAQRRCVDWLSSYATCCLLKPITRGGRARDRQFYRFIQIIAIIAIKQLKNNSKVSNCWWFCVLAYWVSHASAYWGRRVLANLVPNGPWDNAYHKLLHSTFNVPYLLELRENMVHYVHLIDTYAPSVVSSRVWNNESNMWDYWRTDDVVFEGHVLSIRDEAFYANEIKEVRTCVLVE